MKVNFTLFFILLSCMLQSQQTLFMPLEFQKAYKDGTRSFNGAPGENYWQNHCKYSIDVEVIPGSWIIKGSQTIEYTNNSPDSLYNIYIKMHPNHYKKGAMRANEIPVENLTDGMQISNLTVNDEWVVLDNRLKSTNLAPENVDTSRFSSEITVTERSSYIRLNLKKALPPYSKSIIKMDWETSMPLIYVNRMGAYDSKSAFVGYWYPQIAVYDDIDGWDDSEYTGAQEYYLDYSDYNVNIKVPANYKIAATGNLLNAEEVFSKSELERYKSVVSSNRPIIITDATLNTDEENEKKRTTWKFKATNVRDFAFGLSDNFKWIAQKVEVNGKQIISNLVYDSKDEALAEGVLAVQNKSLNFLVNDYPGTPFPYDTFTTYMGVPEFDGMEFPMMANNGLSKNSKSNDYMTFHETSHSYFPHYVGVNEIKYSWMEEGWATFFTIKFIQHLYKDTKYENRQLSRTMGGYLANAGKQWESPLFAPTNHLTIRKGHFQLSYRKPAFMLLALENLLGEQVFKACLKTYINRWKGKHPTPHDFMFTFNDVSKQDLNWFWKKWVFEYGYAEVALKEIKDNSIILENSGGLPVPVKLKLTYADKSIVFIEKTAHIWRDGNKFVGIRDFKFTNLKSVELMSQEFPNLNHSNNKIVLD